MKFFERLSIILCVNSIAMFTKIFLIVSLQYFIYSLSMYYLSNSSKKLIYNYSFQFLTRFLIQHSIFFQEWRFLSNTKLNGSKIEI